MMLNKSLFNFITVLFSISWIFTHMPRGCSEIIQDNRRGDYSNIEICSESLENLGDSDDSTHVNITANQYCDFLNDVASDDNPDGLYDERIQWKTAKDAAIGLSVVLDEGGEGFEASEQARGRKMREGASLPLNASHDGIIPRQMMNFEGKNAFKELEGKTKSAKRSIITTIEYGETASTACHTTSVATSSAYQATSIGKLEVSSVEEMEIDKKEDQEGCEFETLSPSTLNGFRKAAVTFSSTTELILKEDEIGNILIRARDSASTGDKEVQNRTIVESLKAVVPLGVANDLLQDQDSNITRFRIGPDPLTVERLSQILQRCDDTTCCSEATATTEAAEKKIIAKNLVSVDQHPITNQDCNLLYTLLSSSINTHNFTIIGVYNSKEHIFSLKTVSTSGAIIESKTFPEEIESTSININGIPINNRSILLFGSNMPLKKGIPSGPRVEINKILKDYFSQIKIESMNDYNQYTGVGDGITFIKYLDFINEVNSNELINRVKYEKKNNINLRNNKITLDEQKAILWANFLSENNKISQFDFSKKLKTQENKKKFIAKNYKGITFIKSDQDLSPELKDYFEYNYWDDIIDTLSDALQLLEETGKNIKDIDIENLTTRYNALSKEQKKVLDSIVHGAFFRKTSKLGLEFTRDQNTPVLFVWKISDFSELDSPIITTLEYLYKYITNKPYQFFGFTQNGTQKFMKAITASEMCHLSRLKTNENAPSYLLIRNITSPSSLFSSTSALSSTNIAKK